MSGFMNRREFIGGAAATALTAGGPAVAGTDSRMMWAMLLHFGYNMWEDAFVNPVAEGDDWKTRLAADHVRFDEGLWREVTGRLAQEGVNTLVIDLGEALEYPSHPELAVKGSWKADRFRNELKRLRALGFEVIPKLNFSAAHDTWLGDYHKQVSSPAYYRVCADVLRDVRDIFDSPRLMHIGYDEETWINQRYYGHMVVRQGDAWWKDFNWFLGTVEGLGMRPWMWSDYCWDHPHEFLTRCPKGVLQSNWRYGTKYSEEHFRESVGKNYWALRTFVELDRHGFEQVPTGSNYKETIAGNFSGLVDFCDRHVSPKGIRGYMQTSWCPTLPEFRNRLLQAAGLLGEVIRGRDAAKAQASYDPGLNDFIPEVTAETDKQVYAPKEKGICELFWPGY